MDGVPIERARAAKTQLLEKLSALPQLGGIGLVRIGDGFGVKVNLSEPLESDENVPQEIEGVPVVIDIVGRVTAR
jgi:hypothetical protein